MIKYRSDLEGVTEADLSGFYVGWPSPPSSRLAVLRGSSRVVVAWDEAQVVGFVTALTDGVLMAYLPLLEVLPSHQHAGIGSALVSQILDDLGSLYGVDICCDDDVVPFYERFGFQKVNGMVLRPHLKPRLRP